MGERSIKNKIKILVSFILLLGLSLTLNTCVVAADDNQTITVNNTTQITDQSSNSTSSFYAAGSPEDGSTQIRVLIFTWDNVAKDSVIGIKSVLDSANSNNLVPGYYFTYKTTSTINAATLQSYDVLAMPGGEDYITNYNGKTIDSIDPAAIKNFVKNGKGYLGICAGAFSGAYYTKDCYYGWSLAPNVNCLQAWGEKNTDITITSSGQGILGQSDTITTLYWNGPAMSVSGNAFVMATYDGITDSNGRVIIASGMAAIVGDFYGKGRTALIGPHPELVPKSPGIVAKLIVWASNLKPSLDTVAPPPTDSTVETPANSTENTMNTATAASTITEVTQDTSYYAAGSSVPMQKTGTPLIPLTLAVIMILGGLITTHKK